MRYKISYNKKWNNEGTTYSQTLNVTLTRKEFTDLNDYIALAKLNAPSWNTDYKLYLDTFKKGINYTKLTQIKFFAQYFGIISINTNIVNDKRFKQNRNTIVKINII